MSFTYQDFLNYDSHPIRKSDEERFLCMICGNGKPKDNAHRCCSVNTNTELYRCWRCNFAGRLDGGWREAKFDEERAAFIEEKRRERLAKEIENWNLNIKMIVPLVGTMGARYLLRRGINPLLAHNCGARYSDNFYGGKAVVFPMRNEYGKLIAMNCRYTYDKRYVKHRSVRDKYNSVYATHGAFDEDFLVITEGAIDALSLASIGVPAIATCGAGFPSWLTDYALGKTVVIATDGDEAGDDRAAAMDDAFRAKGILPLRVRPNVEKDWNEILKQHGIGMLQQEYICQLNDQRRPALIAL